MPGTLDGFPIVLLLSFQTFHPRLNGVDVSRRLLSRLLCQESRKPRPRRDCSQPTLASRIADRNADPKHREPDRERQPRRRIEADLQCPGWHSRRPQTVSRVAPPLVNQSYILGQAPGRLISFATPAITSKVNSIRPLLTTPCTRSQASSGRSFPLQGMSGLTIAFILPRDCNASLAEGFGW